MNKRTFTIVGVAVVGVLVLVGMALTLTDNPVSAQVLTEERPLLVQDTAPDTEQGEDAPALPADGEECIKGGVIDQEVIKEVTADALGISVAELEAAHEEGTRLPDLAQEMGVDLADVQAAVEAAKAEMVNQAVADGLITQEQADRILSGEGGFGGRHGRGGQRGNGPRGGGPLGVPNGNAPALDGAAADNA